MTVTVPSVAGLLPPALAALAARRPIFHSEADLQLALAWEIQLAYPDAAIRLEQRLHDAPRIDLDVLVRIAGVRFALELKYLKAQADVTLDGERFLLPLGAPDVERYDTLKDLTRLELLIERGLVDAGAVLVITNNPTFWRPGTSGRSTGFDAFRFHDGTRLAGALDWGATAGPGTRRTREAPHVLHDTYLPLWRPFSTVSSPRNGEFRSLTITVPPEAP